MPGLQGGYSARRRSSNAYPSWRAAAGFAGWGGRRRKEGAKATSSVRGFTWGRDGIPDSNFSDEACIGCLYTQNSMLNSRGTTSFSNRIQSKFSFPEYSKIGRAHV